MRARTSEQQSARARERERERPLPFSALLCPSLPLSALLCPCLSFSALFAAFVLFDIVVVVLYHMRAHRMAATATSAAGANGIGVGVGGVGGGGAGAGGGAAASAASWETLSKQVRLTERTRNTEREAGLTRRAWALTRRDRTTPRRRTKREERSAASQRERKEGELLFKRACVRATSVFPRSSHRKRRSSHPPSHRPRPPALPPTPPALPPTSLSPHPPSHAISPSLSPHPCFRIAGAAGGGRDRRAPGRVQQGAHFGVCRLAHIGRSRCLGQRPQFRGDSAPNRRPLATRTPQHANQLFFTAPARSLTSPVRPRSAAGRPGRGPDGTLCKRARQLGVGGALTQAEPSPLDPL